MYPVTIIKDRMGGAYSGAEWLAWPCDGIDDEFIFDACHNGDCYQQDFWIAAEELDIKRYIGLGPTPSDAYEDLEIKIKDLRFKCDTAIFEINALFLNSQYKELIKGE